MSNDIPLALASMMTESYQKLNQGKKKGGCFPKSEVMDLLNQPGCAFLRYYFGNDAGGNLTIVLAGVDENGDDMISKLKNMSDPCPPNCGSPNALNHES